MPYRVADRSKRSHLLLVLLQTTVALKSNLNKPHLFETTQVLLFLPTTHNFLREEYWMTSSAPSCKEATWGLFLTPTQAACLMALFSESSCWISCSHELAPFDSVFFDTSKKGYKVNHRCPWERFWSVSRTGAQKLVQALTATVPK